MDNGHEFIALTLQEWCNDNGSSTDDVDPDSLGKSKFVESFYGRLTNEFLNSELIASLAEVKTFADQHRIEINLS